MKKEIEVKKKNVIDLVIKTNEILSAIDLLKLYDFRNKPKVKEFLLDIISDNVLSYQDFINTLID